MCLEFFQTLRMVPERSHCYCLQESKQNGEANLSPFFKDINFVTRENKQMKRVRAMTNIPPMEIHKMGSLQTLKK